jgi:lysyl-tRNA synthetase class 2
MSTCVANHSYDPETQELTIEFQARGTYRYSEVPLDEAETFAAAGSLGTYFNLYIRDRYPYERIE